MNLEDLKIGDEKIREIEEEISRVQLVKYAGASGDFNPLHTVDEVGKQAGTGVIAHGMLIMGMASKGITAWIPRKYVKKINVRFKKMTYPGEKIQVVCRVVNKKDERIFGEVEAMNTNGEVKVAGKFEAVLPTKVNNREELYRGQSL